MRSTLSSKGQLVIPAAIRDRHGWGPGTRFIIEDQGDALLIRPAASLPRTTLDELASCAGYDGPARSIQEMDQAIAAAIARGE